jgi:hypothetical protein
MIRGPFEADGLRGKGWVTGLRSMPKPPAKGSGGTNSSLTTSLYAGREVRFEPDFALSFTQLLCRHSIVNEKMAQQRRISFIYSTLKMLSVSSRGEHAFFLRGNRVSSSLRNISIVRLVIILPKNLTLPILQAMGWLRTRGSGAAALEKARQPFFRLMLPELANPS